MWWRGSASFLETHRKSCAASISLKIDSKFKTDSNIFQATIGLNSIDVLVIVLCMKKIWVRNLFWTVYTRALQNAFCFVMAYDQSLCVFRKASDSTTIRLQFLCSSKAVAHPFTHQHMQRETCYASASVPGYCWLEGVMLVSQALLKQRNWRLMVRHAAAQVILVCVSVCVCVCVCVYTVQLHSLT